MDRVCYEHTDEALRGYMEPGGAIDLGRLTRLPALVMPETETGDLQVARVGRITDLVLMANRDYSYRFTPTAVLPPIPSSRILGAASQLGIDDEWEFRRTHWAVKAVDLYGVLAELGIAAAVPRVFKLPIEQPQESDLVAVMMPFDAALTPVYEELRDAVGQLGYRCLRADDIWLNDHVMEDVISLIWRARVVVSDLTDRNPNVFYETGIAHTIGRNVIQITQSMNDVPFDLQPIRTITYLNNSEGRRELGRQVSSRLQSIVERAF